MQDELHALDLGVDDYLTKPCNMSRLLARIKNLLRRKEEQVQQTVLLYYFFDMSEREIAKFCNLSRTTVQSRRTSSMKLLKRYLEEKAYDCTD